MKKAFHAAILTSLILFLVELILIILSSTYIVVRGIVMLMGLFIFGAFMDGKLAFRIEYLPYYIKERTNIGFFESKKEKVPLIAILVIFWLLNPIIPKHFLYYNYVGVATIYEHEGVRGMPIVETDAQLLFPSYKRDEANNFASKIEGTLHNFLFKETAYFKGYTDGQHKSFYLLPLMFVYVVVETLIYVLVYNLPLIFLILMYYKEKIIY